MFEKSSQSIDGAKKEREKQPVKVHLIIARHGETPFNVEGKFHGKADTSITEAGAQSAVELSKLLATKKYDAIYAGHFERQIKTAELATGKEPFQDERLHEVDTGEATGKTRKQIGNEKVQKIIEGNFFDYSSVNGESPDDIRERINGFINDIIAKHPNQTVLIFTSAGVARWIAKEYDNNPELHIPTGTLYELDVTKKTNNN